MRLDINYRKRSVKNTNTWRLNNTLLNNEVITEEIKGEIKKYLETRKISNKPPNLLPKGVEKEEQKNLKVSRWKDI